MMGHFMKPGFLQARTCCKERRPMAPLGVAVQVLAPGGDERPAGQVVQEALPGTSEYVPPAQTLQETAFPAL